MSNIRTTVTNVLHGTGYTGYLSVAEPVITALEEREQEIVRALVEIATDRGLTNNEIAGLLSGIGLHDGTGPNLTEAAEESTPDADPESTSLATQVNEMQDLVNRLITAARRAGVAV